MFNLLIVVSLVALVKSHDVTVGSDVTGSNKIFDEDRFASPAIWKQTQNVTINATENEVISKVVVTDMRPEKDGEVKILEGGEGQNNITLELKSPTALRGFAFHIEAYSAPKDKVKVTSATPKVEGPLQPGLTRQRRDPEDHKTDEANFKAPVPTFKVTPNSDASLTHPLATDTKINNENKKFDSNSEQVRPARDVISAKTTETKTTNKPNTDEYKASNTETVTEVPRLTRDAAKEVNVNADEHNLHPAAKDGQTLTHPHPISTFKQASTENPHQISTAKSFIDESNNKDGKRAVRDTETDEEESDDSEQTKKNEKSHDYDSYVPSTLSTENQPPREYKRQVNQPAENNNNSTKTTNNGAYVPPLGFANSDSTVVKTRVVRDTEDKNAKSPPFVTSTDAKSTLPTLSNEKENSGSPSSNNGQRTYGQRANGQSNAPIPRNLTPLPYATSSTTQKSQNKRDTESKASGKEQQKPGVNLKNTPRPYLRQKPKEAGKDTKEDNKQATALSSH